MEPIIQPIDRKLLLDELSPEKFVRNTNRGSNQLYEVTAADSPNIMKEIGRLREISFRTAGGGTGKSFDIDDYDIDPEHPYKQLIVFDPDQTEILGGYRYIVCGPGFDTKKMATDELFKFSDKFITDYLPTTIELGRSFVQPMYQRLNLRRKGIFALDNLWDGLGALIVKYDAFEYFFGKVTMYTSYNYKARNILLNFMNKYFVDEEQLVTPIKPLDFDNSNPYYINLYDGLSYKEAYKVMVSKLKDNGELVPPLINSYMNISPNMRVFGTALNKDFGGVEETGILVSIKDMYPEKTERHIKTINDIIKRRLWWRRSSKRLPI
ncbi:MAG: GNAT family N-acetyltransferase [Bacteroidales bacterium]